MLRRYHRSLMNQQRSPPACMFEAVCVYLSVVKLVYDRSMKTAMFCISLLLLKLISVGLRPEFKNSLKVSTVQKPESHSLQAEKKNI